MAANATTALSIAVLLPMLFATCYAQPMHVLSIQAWLKPSCSAACKPGAASCPSPDAVVGHLHCSCCEGLQPRTAIRCACPAYAMTTSKYQMCFVRRRPRALGSR
ncbi:hypothetical protein COO60DRAFT_1518023 [Scenedesmus sp. NREL 46B-D3]|nr:hypothetical protein COO60DRAFT_1518023 [Scenedesmus sp. NREL 46B-D3]